VSGRLRSESGQAILVTVLFLTVLLGAVALTLDIGVWFREQRQAQATADAAALAGAQALPALPSDALRDAGLYATANGGGVAAGGIVLRDDYQPHDTVVVTVKRTSPGFFSKLFSIDSATVHASAAARAGVPQQAKWVAPIVVNKLHPMLSGPGCPCFRTETDLPLSKTGAPGAFGLVNLDRNDNGTAGSPVLADWIQHGFNQYLELGGYNSDPGAKFNGNDIRDALSARIGTELLFPVYDSLTGGGSNAVYNIIGWVAFHLDSFDLDAHGNSQVITGYFTRVIWDGIQSSTNKNLPDFGVHSISLVN
jgi:putative Flp pilus-assembly TadE/G-like protein